MHSLTNQTVASQSDSPYLGIYAKNYEMPFFSLEKTCDVFNRNLLEINQRLEAITNRHQSGERPNATEDKLAIKSDFMQLIEMRDVCQLSILAKQKFYNESTGGKVAGFFQGAIETLGLESPIAKAEKTLATCQTHIETMCKIDENLHLGLNYDELSNQAHLMADLAIMRRCAITQEKDFYSTRGNTDRSPNQILIAKPNGDVFVIDCKNPIEDEVKDGIYSYQAICYSIGKEQEQVTFVSSFTKPREGDSPSSSNNLTAANNIIKEKRVLHSTGESMTIKIDNTRYAFCQLASGEKPTEGTEMDPIGEKLI